MRVTLILARADNGVIGREGDLPWRLSADLRRFKALTTGHRILMGRKTHESIGRPLPQRVNVVLTRDPQAHFPGCDARTDLEAALAEAREAGETELFVIGGAEIYRLALPFADRLQLTEVHAEASGDVTIPGPGPDWVEVERADHPADERNEHPYSFVVLDRRTS